MSAWIASSLPSSYNFSKTTIVLPFNADAFRLNSSVTVPFVLDGVNVVSAVTSFYEGFQMDHDRFSNGYQPQRNLDRVRRSFSRTRSKYKGK